MSDRQPGVRKVRCPNCGGPLGSSRWGQIMACSYCGAALDSGGGRIEEIIAPPAPVESSTVYLARTEALKRVRQQLSRADESLGSLRELHSDMEHRVKQAAAKSGTGLRFWGVATLLLSVVFIMSGVLECWLIGLVLGFVLVFAAARQKRSSNMRVAELQVELEALVPRGQQARAERDRLAARVTELEAGLDEMAGTL